MGGGGGDSSVFKEKLRQDQTGGGSSVPQNTIWRSNGEYTKNHNIILLLFMLKVTVKIYYRFANLDSDRLFVTCRKHRFIELANLQIPKNVDLSKSMNTKKVIEPSIANYEKNIGCPPLITTLKLRWAPSIGYISRRCMQIYSSLLGAYSHIKIYYAPPPKAPPPRKKEKSQLTGSVENSPLAPIPSSIK